MIQKQGNWVPYELKPRNVERRFFTCEQLIQRQQKKGFFASDCDWRSGYSTTTPKKKKYYAKPGQLLPSTLTSTPRLNIHGSKIMLCIWWDQKGLVYYAAEIWRFHYGQSVSATIDSFELCIAKKTAGIRTKTI